jgi:hypothetical protein
MLRPFARSMFGTSIAAMLAGFAAIGGKPMPAAQQNSRNRSSASPHKSSRQSWDSARLHPGMASSFKKMARWARQDPSSVMQPDADCLRRYGRK